MARKDQYLLELYCRRFGSESTQYVTRRELLRANEDLNLSKWTAQHGHEFIRSMKVAGYSNSTIRLKAQRLRAYFDWAVECGHRTRNPIDFKALPKHRNLRSPQALTISEAKKLLKTIPKSTWVGHRDRVATSLMLILGLRISSVVGIDWKHFEMRGTTLYLNTWGKGGVENTSLIRDDLKKLIEQYKVKCNSTDGPLLTSTEFTNTRLTTRSLRRRIDHYLNCAGLKRSRLSAHSLRATSVTLLMENGASLLELQQHLNHRSPETTIAYLARLERLKNNLSDKIPIKV